MRGFFFWIRAMVIAHDKFAIRYSDQFQRHAVNIFSEFAKGRWGWLTLRKKILW